MLPLDMVNQVCSEGQIVLFASGKYSDERPRFLGRVLKPFSMDMALGEFTAGKDGALPKWELFVTWLLRNGYIEPLEHVEVHMDAHWGEKDLIEMVPIETQADIVDMAAGKACPRCASHHVVPPTVDGRVDMSRRQCTDCGQVFNLPEPVPA